MLSTDESELLPCPVSQDRIEGIAERYEIHYAPRRELAEPGSGGVCRNCRQKFKHRHHAMQNGREETPVEFHRENHITVERNHAAVMDESGEVHPVEGFDYDKVDEKLGFIAECPDEVRAQAAQLVRRIFLFCWSDTTTIRAAFGRFASLSRGVFPDIVEPSFNELAHALGVTKQNVSKLVHAAEAAFGMKFSTTRSLSARQSMRRARLKNPVPRSRGPRKHKVATTPGKDSF